MDRHEADILGERLSPQAHRPRNDLILRAMRGEATERTPVWLMRQAGRFDPAYRDLRERAGLELEELFAHPELAAEITTLPLRFGVDAAILFQDILTPLGPMGAPFVFRPGPVLERPIDSPEAAAALELYDPTERLDFVKRSIELTLARIDGAAPLLGFAGAPLTLLAFLVEGGSPGAEASRFRAFLRDHAAEAEALLDRLAQVTGAYLRMQLDAGVHAIQLFESCASLVSVKEYERFALPHQQAIMAGLGPRAPRILFARDTAPEVMCRSGADVISIGAGYSLAAAREAAPAVALQGNVDNVLLRDGTPEQVRSAAEHCIREGGGHGHVLNLGHGALVGTPVENVCAMIEAAHECTACRS